MNFFRKAPATPPAATGQPATPSVPQSTGDGPKLTAEEMARRWFEQQTGAPMPEEVKTWFKNLARLEARKQQAAGALLDNNQLQKLNEARRLCETKLAGTEQSIEHLREQQEWLRRFTKLNSSLEEARTRLFEVNKRVASAQSEADELERFETFESVQGRFQRIVIMERYLQLNKELQAQEQIRLSAARQKNAEAQKELEQTTERRTEAEKRLAQMQDTLAEGHRIGGALGILDLNRLAMEKHLATLRQEYNALKKEVEEMTAEHARLTDGLTEKRQKRQVLEVHRQMLEQGEVMLVKLDWLLDTHKRREQLKGMLERSLQKQDEENMQLGRLFREYQALEAEIHTLQSELHMHRESNRGLDSYSLQTRAMELKRRRQLLNSALSLWRRIAGGYTYLSEAEQKIARTKRQVEAQAAEIATKSTEVKRLREVCEEKKYAYTLSRSQNVIHLRGDLHEGTSCSVCGATHHPFHADTMLEQSKLIGEMKTDYELMAAELRSKEEALEALKLEHAAECARLEVEIRFVQKIEADHRTDVSEWAPFSKLDRGFEDCSPSTNKEAREAMLKQLIEKITQDAETAQKDLDTFNFHQSRINRINEQIAAKESAKSQITVRLNEVNTGCQVMAGQVEQLKSRISKMHERHSRLYEALDKEVSYPNWYKSWSEAPENLKIRLQQHMSEWQAMNSAIAGLETKAATATLALQDKEQALVTLEKRIAFAEKNLAAAMDLRQEQSNTFERHFGTKSVNEVQQEMQQTLDKAREHEHASSRLADEAREALHACMGSLRTAQAEGESLEAALVEERSALDLWIRKFNAANPPVQYAELERVLSSETDRNVQRKELRALQTDLLLARIRVDELRAAMVAHQAESVRLPSRPESEDAWAALIQQKDMLERRRREILTQMGTYDARLEAHQKAAEQQRLLQEEMEKKMHD